MAKKNIFLMLFTSSLVRPECIILLRRVILTGFFRVLKPDTFYTRNENIRKKPFSFFSIKIRRFAAADAVVAAAAL